MISKFLKSENWPIGALLVSVFMLAAAHAFERFMLLAPCPLCLKQREVYWAALTIAALAIAITRFVKSPRLVFPFNAVLALTFCVSLWIASYHVGVEWGVFELPKICASQATDVPKYATDVDLDKAYAIPTCDKVPWSLFGISMAGYNVLISFGLIIVSAIAAFRSFAKK